MAAIEGEWLIKLERGWSTWVVGEQPFRGSPETFRYMFGKTEFQVEFQNETEGTSTNLSTGKSRPLCFVAKGQAPPSDEEAVQPPQPQTQTLISEDRPMQTTKVDSNLPTCCYLATSGTQSYEGEFQWLIELEKGWSPWMPGNEPFDGNTDEPLRYTLGRYDFEVHFEDESHGTQTNLTSGKVRRIQRLRKGEAVPAWEGTGIRRRPANAGAAAIAQAPAESAAMAAQSNRAVRRTAGYPAASATSAPVKGAQKFALRTSKPAAAARPQVSEAAHKATTVPSASKAPTTTAGGNVPRFMRPLKSKA